MAAPGTLTLTPEELTARLNPILENDEDADFMNLLLDLTPECAKSAVLICLELFKESNRQARTCALALMEEPWKGYLGELGPTPMPESDRRYSENPLTAPLSFEIWWSRFTKENIDFDVLIELVENCEVGLVKEVIKAASTLDMIEDYYNAVASSRYIGSLEAHSTTIYIMDALLAAVRGFGPYTADALRLKRAITDAKTEAIRERRQFLADTIDSKKEVEEAVERELNNVRGVLLRDMVKKAKGILKAKAIRRNKKALPVATD